MMSGRNAAVLFTGMLDVAFGALLVLFGKDSLILFAHGGVGVPMWAGVGLVMVGLGNIVSVLTRDKKRNRESLNINFGTLMLNLIGMILAAFIIGFYTWGAWGVLSLGITTATEDSISIYSTVILMAAVIFIVSMMAMFLDCCSYALFGGDPYGTHPPRPRYYDGPYGPGSAGALPAHIYKQ